MIIERHLVRQKYTLTNQGIADCIEKSDTLLTDAFNNEEERITFFLQLEEVLLNNQEHFGEDESFELHIQRLFGRLNFQLLLKGEMFDPFNLIEDDDSISYQFSKLLSDYSNTLTYQYHSGKNRLNISFEKKTKLSGMVLLVIAIAAGLIFGWGGTFLPETILIYPAEIFQTIQNILLGLISFAALPIVFLSVIKGVTACGSLQNFGQRGAKTLRTFSLISLIVLLFTALFSCVAFPLNWQMSGGSGSIFDMLLSVFIGIFPSNLLAPFVEGDMLQVVLIGLLIGCTLLILGEKVHLVTTLIDHFSSIFSMIMQWFCNLIPLALFCMIATNVWNGSFVDSLDLWPILVAMVFLSVIYMVLTALVTSKIIKKPLSEIIKAILPPTLIGLSTASSVSAFQSMKKALTDHFHVEDDYAVFALPMGISLFGVGGIVLFILVLLFSAHLSGIAVSASWLITALLLIYIFSFASPPVAGGAIAIITLLFSTQGIGEEWLAGAFVCVMIMEYIATGFRIGLLVMISTCQAKGLGLIDQID